jgi:PPOX class probable F420-dependent enzyme
MSRGLEFQPEEIMPLSPEALTLLSRPNFAHFCTLMPDGAPQSTPVWIGLEGERILIGTGEGSRKAKNARRDPRVSLSVVDFHNPYEEVQIRGRVVEFRDDSSFKIMDAISQKYIGKEFPMRNPAGRVALVIEVEQAKYNKLPFQHTPPE